MANYLLFVGGMYVLYTIAIILAVLFKFALLQVVILGAILTIGVAIVAGILTVVGFWRDS